MRSALTGKQSLMSTKLLASLLPLLRQREVFVIACVAVAGFCFWRASGGRELEVAEDSLESMRFTSLRAPSSEVAAVEPEELPPAAPARATPLAVVPLAEAEPDAIQRLEYRPARQEDDSPAVWLSGVIEDFEPAGH
ncbi:MAG: hypothetical protein DWQ29_17140 [Planctomycetota bacterium]|nr:MAG: hypothetical protein DWQ29_17140 [Planctomycetota bacterium]